ncbi:hypothetical protein MAR_027434 [Mya arenaria]|uniref:Uncharacterized protein n=1 Tax=Mya arenaria TaxID=6604 RepID=A0ABY7EWC4_MYAAR|nr:hypothetical protein MAR_027434 [Mya arenaria]
MTPISSKAVFKSQTKTFSNRKPLETRRNWEQQIYNLAGPPVCTSVIELKDFKLSRHFNPELREYLTL